MCELIQSLDCKNPSCVTSLGFLLDLLFLIVEEHHGENTDAGHHAEGRGVVRVGGGDEPLVLVMTEWDHRDLNR